MFENENFKMANILQKKMIDDIAKLLVQGLEDISGAFE